MREQAKRDIASAVAIVLLAVVVAVIGNLLGWDSDRIETGTLFGVLTMIYIRVSRSA